MKPERWQQIEQLCQAALQLEESQRAAFLEEASGGDQALRQEVERLLRREQEADDFLEASALEVAARNMAEEQATSRVVQQVGPYKTLSLLGAGGMLTSILPTIPPWIARWR